MTQCYVGRAGDRHRRLFSLLRARRDLDRANAMAPTRANAPRNVQVDHRRRLTLSSWVLKVGFFIRSLIDK